MISLLFFDLDNTLYPESSGLMNEIGRRMTIFVSRYLNVSENKAYQLRKNRGHAYGTTFEWLENEHGLENFDSYLEFVHPKEPGKYLKKDKRLTEMLNSIKTRKTILTNSPCEHAQRVLEFLEIQDCFDALYDWRYNGFRGKPDISVFEKLLSENSVNANQALLIDDMAGHLESFAKMGGSGILINERLSETRPGTSAEQPFPVISNILELPNALARFDIRINH